MKVKINQHGILHQYLFYVVTAVLYGDKDTAKSKLIEIGKSSKDNTEFATKLSALVVGKEFRIKVVGKEIEGGKGRFIKSEFASSPGLAEAKGANRLTFDENKNIKRLPLLPVSNTTFTDDMPF